MAASDPMTQTVATDPPAAQHLRRGVLGVGAITFFVVSAAAPLGSLAGGFPVAMLLGNGAGIPATLCLVVLVLLCFSVGYTAMARHVTNAGGFYAFAAQGIGGVAGGSAAMVALLSYNALQIGIYGLFGTACANLGQELFGIRLPWWSYAFAALLTIAVLGYRQLDLSVRILTGLVLVEYLGIVLLDVAILRAGGAEGVDALAFTSGAVFGGSPAIGLLFCCAAFVGFEATTIYGEEARDPERTIPAATYVSVLLIGGFYAFSTWCMVVGAGADRLVASIAALRDPTNFIFVLSDGYAGAWFAAALRVLFVTSIFAGLLAFHNAVARYFYVLGREGLLPARLGAAHRRYGSPYAGSAAQTIIAAVVILCCAIAGLDPVLSLFSPLSNLGTLGIVCLMAVASLAVPVFFRRHPTDMSSIRTKALPVVSCVALSFIAILATVHFDILTGTSRLLATGLPALIPVAACAGAVLAARLRRRAPERFAALGRNQIGIVVNDVKQG